MGKIGLIIWREFWTRVRKPSFLIMTILGPILLVGGIALAAYVTLQESGVQNVLVIDKAQLVTGKLKETNDVKFFYQHEEMSDSVFKASPYAVMVDVNEKVITNNTIQLFYKSAPSIFTQNVISREIEKVLESEKLRLNNVDPEVYRDIKTALKIQLFDIAKADKRSYTEVRGFIGFAFGYLIFFFIFFYGAQVMRGVMEEKQNRIVEVLIGSVRPFQLMMGKVVGIALVGLTQFILWVVLSSTLGLVGTTAMKDRLTAQAQQQPQMTVQLQEQLAGEQAGTAHSQENEALKMALEIWDEMPVAAVLSLFVFYFLGGYLLYASLFAAIGAAVDAETDSQQFMLPITVPMIIAIMIAQSAIQNPSSTAVFWSSLIPFTSPIVMMIRVATGNAFANPVELVLSMVLLVATFIGTTWLAGRIYRTGILMYGKKVNWKELGKWLTYKG